MAVSSMARLCGNKHLSTILINTIPRILTCSRNIQTHSSEKGEDFKFDILEASLKHVKNHGWSETSLKLAIAELKISEACLSMFKYGGADIFLHYNQSLADELDDMMAQQQDDRLPGSDPPPMSHFLKDAIKTRLELQLPYYDHWPEGISLCLNPKVAPEATKQFVHLIDDIWFYAGDKSVDINWYTRRAAVAAVYGLTELFMLQDDSPHFTDTWEFLDRRIQDIENIGENKLELEKNLKYTNDFVKGAFIIARNMLSLNK